MFNNKSDKKYLELLISNLSKRITSLEDLFRNDQSLNNLSALENLFLGLQARVNNLESPVKPPQPEVWTVSRCIREEHDRLINEHKNAIDQRYELNDKIANLNVRIRNLRNDPNF